MSSPTQTYLRSLLVGTSVIRTRGKYKTLFRTAQSFVPAKWMDNPVVEEVRGGCFVYGSDALRRVNWVLVGNCFNPRSTVFLASLRWDAATNASAVVTKGSGESGLSSIINS